jgi:hypothetical protein
MRSISPLLAGLLLLPALACSETKFVEAVEVSNDTAYPTKVSVRGGEGGWLHLLTVQAGETQDVNEVIDQGDIWIFRFRYAGRAEVVKTFSRDDLDEAAWRIEVPPELEESLRERDVAPPP